MKYKVGDKVTISDVRKIKGIKSTTAKYSLIGKKAKIRGVHRNFDDVTSFPYTIIFEDGTHDNHRWREAEFGKTNEWEGGKNKWQKNY